MIYVALLRGINVGGNNKISMKLLKETFERAGMEEVIAYINSGNVIFKATDYRINELSELLEKAILEDFSLDIKVLLRTHEDFERLLAMIPEDLSNDGSMKCDILFLWEDITPQELIDQVKPKADIDTVISSDTEVIWVVSRDNVTKSKLNKLIGTKAYKKVTVRNINTTRKIYTLMNSIMN
ncbi:DUF1697 domain-containing protein [Alloiococcus sp. CFN-8]|uniref:DUF1697 domain-containing protein n=1 Tax=Alloiococcus sp. CFN-8 TaxID=3416081 RepID=UPI003CF08C0C